MIIRSTNSALTVDEHLESAFLPRETVVLDESMIKSFHKNLQGKIQII